MPILTPAAVYPPGENPKKSEVIQLLDEMIDDTASIRDADTTFAGVKTFTDGGILATDALGAGGVGRSDAQIELTNAGGGHALLAITNVVNPGDTSEECAISFQAYDSTGDMIQMASISAVWPVSAVPSAANPGSLRFNASGTDQSNIIAQRIFSDGSITFYGASETDRPAQKQIQVNRTSGIASVIGGPGALGVAIDGAKNGEPTSPVALNAYNDGVVTLGFGGGQTQVYATAGSSSASAAMRVGAVSGRSINAAGTVNASGADYAEYMVKAEGCGEVAKGAIVGIDRDGHITDKWADAVHFMVKSTNPSYVGGDVWAQAMGIEPPEPPSLELVPFHEPEPRDEAERSAWRERKDGHERDLHAQRANFEAVTLEQYRVDQLEYEATREAARTKVDRIAFAGQVPVNVLGTSPGDYIVPVQDGDGIAGAVLPMTGLAYAPMNALGKVIAIEDDGRARIVVRAA